MSQHNFYKSDGRRVLYGLDKPTGGFFITEFYRDDELGECSDDVVETHDGLTLTDLQTIAFEKYSFDVSTEVMKNEFLTSPNPTEFNLEISMKLFHVDVMSLLENVSKDIDENYSLV